ncbi:MAG: cyclase family protein [Streptosporangiaceae bacterium]
MNAPIPSGSSGFAALIAAAAGARVVQLGHMLRPGQTRNGTAPPYSHTLTNGFDEEIGSVPGQSPSIRGVSDMISLGCHTGTHMDSLAHVSYNGQLFDGTKTSDQGVADYFGGVVMKNLAENFRPIVARGVLLDFARYLGVDRAPQDYVITPQELAACAASQDVTFGRGDVVLFRMGYDTVYRDVDEFLRMPIPGPDPDTARELVRAGIVATGADTMPYEAAPGAEPMQVHAELIPKAGVFIFEMLDLREMSELDAREFLFVALPLRIEGGTGSPINPVALVAR